MGGELYAVPTCPQVRCDAFADGRTLLVFSALLPFLDLLCCVVGGDDVPLLADDAVVLPLLEATLCSDGRLPASLLLLRFGSSGEPGKTGILSVELALTPSRPLSELAGDVVLTWARGRYVYTGSRSMPLGPQMSPWSSVTM